MSIIKLPVAKEDLAPAALGEAPATVVVAELSPAEIPAVSSPLEITDETVALDDARETEAVCITQEFEEVTKSIGSLEDMGNLVDNFEEGGGMTESTAAAVGVGLEHIYTTLGIISKELDLTLESFQDERRTSTRIVMEDIHSKIDAVWKALVEMMKRFLQWFQDFFGDLLVNIKGLTNRAKALVEPIQRLTGSPQGDIEDVALQKRLYSPDVPVGRLSAGFQDLAHAVYMGHTQMLSVMGADFNIILVTLGQTANDISRPGKDGGGGDLQVATLKAIKKAGENVFGKTEKSYEGVPAAPKTTTVYSSPAFLGGVGYYSFIPKDWEGISDVKFGTYRAKEGEYDHLPVLTKNEMKEVITSILAFSRLKEFERKNIEELKSLQEALSDIVVNVSGHVWLVPSDLREVRSQCARALLRVVTSQNMHDMSHLIRTGRDMLRLTEMSMAKYDIAPEDRVKLGFKEKMAA